MNIRIILLIINLVPALALAQPDGREPIYDPAADAKSDIAAAVATAATEGKHVLVQLGGNWCVWCYRFHDFVAADSALNAQLAQHYVTVHVNYSQENMNEALLSAWDFPQRFGFPVFVVLDAEGNRLHTQNSAYLEEGKGYSTDKVRDFFRHWTPTAVDPASYARP